jgi:hypothetical protein
VPQQKKCQVRRVLKKASKKTRVIFLRKKKSKSLLKISQVT